MSTCLQTESFPPKIEERKKEYWQRGLVCPKCGMIKETSSQNTGERKYCSLCGFYGTFLYKKLWLCDPE